MGSFDVSCFLTRKTIHPGDEVALFPLREDKYYKHYPTINSPYIIAYPPLLGVYDDYGRICTKYTHNHDYWDHFCEIHDVEFESIVKFLNDRDGENILKTDNVMFCDAMAWDHFSTRSYPDPYDLKKRHKNVAHIKTGMEIHERIISREILIDMDPTGNEELDAAIEKLREQSKRRLEQEFTRYFTDQLQANPFEGMAHLLIAGELNAWIGRLHLFEIFRQGANVHILPSKCGTQHGHNAVELALARFSLESCRHERRIMLADYDE